jgi:hypothetical protein
LQASISSKNKTIRQEQGKGVGNPSLAFSFLMAIAADQMLTIDQP